MAFRIVPDDLLKYLDKYDTYYILGHLEPDGDCIGSQTALGSFLRRRGKEVTLFNPGPFKRKEIILQSEEFLPRLTESQKARSAGVVVLDCAARDRIGSLWEDIAGRDIAVIDHHSSGEDDFGTVRYIDTAAPCVTLLVQKIIETLGDEPTLEEARHLFAGFATDTGFFRHLEVEAAESLAMVARLAAKGVSPRALYNRIYGSYSFESRQYIADAISTAERFFHGKLILVHELLDHARGFTEENRQTDTVYQLLLAIEGCEALAFIREEEPGKTSVSFRSVNTVNVGTLAREFGGGGHKNAAGFTTPLPYNEIRPQILVKFSTLFQPPGRGE
jgi:phosphoesterase RecJ-like protein